MDIQIKLNRISSLVKTGTRKMMIALIPVIMIGLIGLKHVTAQTNTAFEGAKTSWHGFDRYDFIMDEATLAITPSKSPEGEGNGIKDPVKGQRRCVVVVPKKVAPGTPWSWRGCYWDHQPQTEVELLNRGFHVAYISANQDLKPGKQWEAWYEFLTGKYGFSPKPAFIGMSRGGEYSYIWATTHPDKVSCLYTDNPGGNSEVMKGIVGLALNDVPILHVCGSIDPILGRYSLPVENIYHQMGGRFSMMIKEGFGHHPHSLHNPKIIADFIEQSVNEKKAALPNFANEKSTVKSYYNTTGTFSNFPEEGAYITCRGPVFTECYKRYEIEIPGVEAFSTIIAPRKAAPGNPWVFRSDFVNWDATVDLALLAKGYHIVTGAVPYNADGPIMAQWNIIYKYLTDRGFSPKVAMEGRGGATGEVYTWAIANPEKVSCIYAENPILHSNLAKVQPIDNLAPMAKAGIPILNICGGLDSNLMNQIREAEKRYKELGGRVTLVTKEGKGNSLLVSEILDTVVDFITKNTK